MIFSVVNFLIFKKNFKKFWFITISRVYERKFPSLKHNKASVTIET